MDADILFDLDGTLIDSSPGILASFGRILAADGLRPAVPLEASLIG
ncbi:MAG: HAD hydrolase-like protein, partial [Rhodocyclaceae bacterium]|nr:HAD hydrolase-like protein [Rhodocyclaceae bacterium]